MRLLNLYFEEEWFEEVLELDNDDLENIFVKWNIVKVYKVLEMDDSVDYY